MKILKHGTDPLKKKLHGECRRCGCQVECTRSEAKVLNDRDSRGIPDLYVRCPDCKETHLWVR